MQKAAAINNLGLSASTTTTTSNHLSTKLIANNPSSQTSPTQIILTNNLSSSLSVNGIPANNNSSGNSSYQQHQHQPRHQPRHQHQHQQQQNSTIINSHHISASTGSPLISPAPINHHQHSHHHSTTTTSTSHYINPISASNAIGFSSVPSTSSAIIDSSIVKEEIKTHFSTGEGIYKKMTVATYSRPNKPTMLNTVSNKKI